MKEQLLEKLRLKKEIFLCEKDPIYFMKNYVKCTHRTKGVVPFTPYSFQKEYIDVISKGNTIAAAVRQSGSSITTTLYLFWEGFFQNKAQVFTAHRIEWSVENLQTIRYAYMALPSWLRDYNPMVVNNKQRIEFANGSRFLAVTATEHSFHGISIDNVFMDTFSSIRSANDVLASLIPVMPTSGKIIIVSSGRGSEVFNEMFVAATSGNSQFTAIRIRIV